MSSISSSVTGYRNNDWGFGFSKQSLGDLKVSGISLFTVLATLTIKKVIESIGCLSWIFEIPIIY